MNLIINPGSTSTKIALYKGSLECFSASVEHSGEVLSRFQTAGEQFEYRKEEILRVLAERGYGGKVIHCVMGRGGAGLKPVKAGTYEVNDRMVQRLRDKPLIDHASNLGALIARSLADQWGVRAYVCDPVTTDELNPLARLTGIAGVERGSTFHALNSRAMARLAAQESGRNLEEMNFVVAHLGGGITLCALEGGRAIDICSDDEGPYSPERAGAIPAGRLVDLCYEEGMDRSCMKKRIRGQGGFASLLGTKDARMVEDEAAKGVEPYRLVQDGMIYQVAKAIGSLATTLCGKVDTILLTGSLARSSYITQEIIRRVEFIAPVKILPGENEMVALAEGALRLQERREKPYEYCD